MNSQAAVMAGHIAVDSNEEKALISKVAWRLMPLIMLCYLFAFFDRINISFAKFALQSELGFSDTVYGLGASLFVVGYVAFEVPSNMLLYKFGPNRWIARIMVSWGLATAAMIFVTSEWQFYVLRFLIGAMEAGFSPGILYYLTIWFPAKYRGRITSYFFVASACSGLIGGPAAGLILGHLDGFLGIAGWHWLFLAGGVPCIGLGIMVLFYLDNSIESAKWLSRSEKDHLSSQISQQAKNIRTHSMLGAFKAPAVLLLGGVYFLIQIVSYGLNFWVPHMIRASGVTNVTWVGVLSAVPYLCGAICMVVVGRLSDRSGERRKFLCALLLMGSAGFLMAGLFDQNPALLVFAVAVMGAGVIASIPAFWTLPAKVVHGAAAASGIALINTLGHFGGIVSPIMVGRVRDMTGSTTPALYVIAICAFIVAMIVLFGLPEQLRRKDTPVNKT